jgi:hypothetical protein
MEVILMILLIEAATTFLMTERFFIATQSTNNRLSLQPKHFTRIKAKQKKKTVLQTPHATKQNKNSRIKDEIGS